MKNQLVSVLAFLVKVLLISNVSVAETGLPRIFSDHMVLQRNAEVRIWGWDRPGEDVTVRMAGQHHTVRTGDDGTWEASLSPMDAGGPYEMDIEGSGSVSFKDILVGEVWVCSGQSNMEWSVRQSADAGKEIQAAVFPEIRLFTVPRRIAVNPKDDLEEGQWLVCSPETVSSFSAVAYYFGRHLHVEKGIPVGLIHSSWGGTVAETWISRESMEEMEDFHDVLAQSGSFDPDSLALRGVRYGPNMFPGLLFNGMIAPITDFSVRGAIWYQGESNAGRAYQYRRLFPLLIRDWRKQWDNDDMPFLFVQLANYMAALEKPEESEWAELREAQTMALALPNTGMAVAIDIGEADDIHPGNKQDVGLRLALAARNVAYGEEIVSSGPLYSHMKPGGDRIRIVFDHTGGGLVAKGRYGYLKGFAIAGEDRVFHWARAYIDGNEVVVYSDKVSEPVAVRYGWANNPEDANLYNLEGLPASPFRTDSWPGITAGRK